MRFKLDENLPFELVELFSAAGHDAVTVGPGGVRDADLASDLFHRTADLDFHPGYENRRINVTMLFGYRRARAALQ